MNNELSKFYEGNYISYKDFGDRTKFHALKLAIINYYDTASLFKDGFFDYIRQNNDNGILLTAVKSGEFLLKYTASISYIHLFFEHTIYEILENIDPVLARGTLNKEIDLVHVLSGDFSNIKVRDNRIKISIAFERLKALIELDARLTSQHKVPQNFHFLLDHFDLLKRISLLRNEITHSGQKLLDRYAYEVLFVNEILPLVRRLLNEERPHFFIERNLACGFNTIDEIIRDPLPIDLTDGNLFQSLQSNLRRINHFKELGRASYNNKLYMGESDELDNESIERHYNVEIKQKGKTLAEMKSRHLGHFKVHACPCCGTESLSTFSYWYEYELQKTSVREAECSLCTYAVSKILGEPKEFGIMTEELFQYVD
jgi:hypothetical protein